MACTTPAIALTSRTMIPDTGASPTFGLEREVQCSARRGYAEGEVRGLAGSVLVGEVERASCQKAFGAAPPPGSHRLTRAYLLQSSRHRLVVSRQVEQSSAQLKGERGRVYSARSSPTREQHAPGPGPYLALTRFRRPTMPSALSPDSSAIDWSHLFALESFRVSSRSNRHLENWIPIHNDERPHVCPWPRVLGPQFPLRANCTAT